MFIGHIIAIGLITLVASVIIFVLHFGICFNILSNPGTPIDKDEAHTLMELYYKQLWRRKEYLAYYYLVHTRIKCSKLRKYRHVLSENLDKFRDNETNRLIRNRIEEKIFDIDQKILETEVNIHNYLRQYYYAVADACINRM